MGTIVKKGAIRTQDAIQWRPSQVGWRPFSRNKKLLVAKGKATRSKKLLVAPGLTY